MRLKKADITIFWDDHKTRGISPAPLPSEEKISANESIPPKFFKVNLHEVEKEISKQPLPLNKGYYAFLIFTFICTSIIYSIALLPAKNKNQQYDFIEIIKIPLLNAVITYFFEIIRKVSFGAPPLILHSQKRINTLDENLVLEIYDDLEREFPNELSKYMGFNKLDGKKVFLEHMFSKMKGGLCLGYSMEFICSLVSSEEKNFYSLIKAIDRKRKDVLKKQLLHVMAFEFSQEHKKQTKDIKDKSLGIVIDFGGDGYMGCALVLMKNFFNFPGLVAINNRRIIGRDKEMGASSQKEFMNMFTQRLENHDYVDLESLKEADLILDEEGHVSTDDNNGISASENFYNKNATLVSLKNYIIAGCILTAKKDNSSGHAAAYAITKKSCYFFDCNMGLFRYPSLSEFSKDVCKKKSRGDKFTAVTSMIVKHTI